MGVWNMGVWSDGVWDEDSAPQVAVPSVIGQADSAAADAILEGDGLDLGTDTPRCSTATENEIVSQNPAAGTQVALGSLVDVYSSNGVACTGRPLPINIRQRIGL